MSTMDSAPAPDPREARTVTLEVPLGAEALDRVLPRRYRETTLEMGRIWQLGAALMTILIETRDRQHKFVYQRDDKGKVIGDIPTLRHYKDLHDAGRLAAVAITHLETALFYAREASERGG
jgi:hypothetical protein